MKMPLNIPHSPESNDPVYYRRMALSAILALVSSGGCGIEAPVKTGRDFSQNSANEESIPTTPAQLINSQSTPHQEAEFHRIQVDTEGVSSGLRAMAEIAPGQSWLGKMEGNGGRDVMIYIPSYFEEGKKTELIYHFHGTHSDMVEAPHVPLKMNGGDYVTKQDEPVVGTRRLHQVLACAEQAQENGKNVILVYPLSEGGRGKPGASAMKNGYDGHWMKQDNSTNDDMFRLDEEVHEVLENDLKVNADINKVTLKGHSAGGVPLMWIMQSGFPFDRMDYLDASYGNWAYKYYDVALQTNPKMEINVFYIGGSETSRHLRPLERKKHPKLIKAKRPHGHMMYHYFNWEREE